MGFSVLAIQKNCKSERSEGSLHIGLFCLLITICQVRIMHLNMNYLNSLFQVLLLLLASRVRSLTSACVSSQCHSYSSPILDHSRFVTVHRKHHISPYTEHQGSIKLLKNTCVKQQKPPILSFISFEPWFCQYQISVLSGSPQLHPSSHLPGPARVQDQKPSG